MSNILSPVALDNEFLGMTKINLASIWGSPPRLTPDTYRIYKDMNFWLRASNVSHRFFWDDTGQFLPTGLYMDVKSDTATYFMLKYGSCK